MQHFDPNAKRHLGFSSFNTVFFNMNLIVFLSALPEALHGFSFTIVFILNCRRGYTTERQKGVLLVEKLDYLQSRLLQKIFFIISKPLEKFGIWMNEVISNISLACLPLPISL